MCDHIKNLPKPQGKQIFRDQCMKCYDTPVSLFINSEIRKWIECLLKLFSGVFKKRNV